MRLDRRPLLHHVAVALAMMLAAVACSLPTDDEAAIIPPEDLPDALRSDLATTTTVDPGPRSEPIELYLLAAAGDRNVVVQVMREIDAIAGSNNASACSSARTSCGPSKKKRTAGRMRSASSSSSRRRSTTPALRSSTWSLSTRTGNRLPSRPRFSPMRSPSSSSPPPASHRRTDPGSPDPVEWGPHLRTDARGRHRRGRQPRRLRELHRRVGAADHHRRANQHDARDRFREWRRRR